MQKRKIDFSILYTILFVVLLLYVVSYVFVFGWGLMTSFKDQFSEHGYYFNKIGLPNPWVFSNYTTAFAKLTVTINNVTYYLENMYFNAILYAVGCAFFNTLIPCLTAYIIARYKFFFSKIVYTFVIVQMSLNIVGSTPSSLQMMHWLGMYDTIWGMWIMSANFLAGIYFLIFYETFHAMSSTYKEAAEIDGASDFQVMVSIMLPLAKNIFGTVFLLRLITYWNEYQIPVLYLPSHPTIAYGLFTFFFQSDNVYSTTPMKITGAFLVMTPILVLFCIFQKRIMGNLTAGGIKE